MTSGAVPHYTMDKSAQGAGQADGEGHHHFKVPQDNVPVFIRSPHEKGFLVAEIYGQPTGREVEMRSEQDYFRDLDRGTKWSTYKQSKRTEKY
jgi:hypothetical protein